MKTLRVVDYRDWPKPTPTKGTGLAALIDADFDAIAALLGTKPKAFTQRATKFSPQVKYRSLFLILSNRALATLTEFLDGPGSIELGLQVSGGEFVFEDDLSEVVSTLKLKPDQVQKLGGVMNTWLPNRKAKRVSNPGDPLPEEWWKLVDAAVSSIAQRKR